MVRSECQLWDALKMIIGRSLRERMKILCKNLLDSGEYTEIDSVLSTIRPIEEDVRRLSNTGAIDSDSLLYKATRTVTKVLEGLLLNVMEDLDVRELEYKGLLLYQVVPDIILE